MPDHQYIWLIWSVAFLCPWAVLYVVLPEHRAAMWRMSSLMAHYSSAMSTENRASAPSRPVVGIE